MATLRSRGARGWPAPAAALGLCVLLSGVLPASAQQGGPEFRVVVNARNPVDGVGAKYLADLFLKRATHWPDGTVAEPVDQLPDSRVRRVFDEEVLGRSVQAVRNAWEEAIFSGRDVPPPELAGDEAVLQYVAAHEGAVGYVSPQAVLPPTVRRVEMR